MKIKSLILTLVLLAASFLLVQGQTFDNTKLDRFFDQLLANNQAMGALTITKEGRVVYSKAMGFGEIAGTERKPLTAASRFQIGSITKMFTAVMIFQLAEEKKLSLSDTLDKYVPKIPNASKITLAQVLGHRSGIHNVFGDPAQEPWPPQEPITKEDLLARIARGTPDFEPDTQHRYSNSGYTVLGFVIEQVTGKSYGDALKERITSKIGLNDTYLTTSTIDAGKGEVFSYRRFPEGWRQGNETHPTILFSAGAIISTLGDMTKFIQAIFEGKLVSPESLVAMKTMREGEGMGMVTFTWEGKIFFGETGGSAINGAWLSYLPEEKLAIVYATNAKVYTVAEIMKGIAAIYYNQPFEIPTWDKIEVAPEILDKYVGVYSSPPARFTITRQGSILYVQPGTQSAGPTEAKAANRFEITTGVTIEFDVEKRQMTLKRPQGERVFTKE